MKDTAGRDYAKITELNPGDLVQVDAGFTCMTPNDIKTLFYDDDEGFHYVNCTCGKHGLGGQLADDGIHLIGVYKI